MDQRATPDPSIATLPRQPDAQQGPTTGTLPPRRLAAAALAPSSAGADLATFLARRTGAEALFIDGFARRAAARERRLGWVLWGGLVVLVLVLSAAK